MSDDAAAPAWRNSLLIHLRWQTVGKTMVHNQLRAGTLLVGYVCQRTYRQGTIFEAVIYTDEQGHRLGRYLTVEKAQDALIDAVLEGLKCDDVRS